MKTYLNLPDEFEEFIIFCQAKQLTERTVAQYAYELALFLRWLAERNQTPYVSVEAITHRVINKYLADKRPWKAKGESYKALSPHTIQGRYLTLSSFFSWAVPNLELTVNPMAKVPAPQVPATEPRTTELEEYEALERSIKLNSWVAFRDRLAVRTFFLTGIRLEGLVNLMIEDYNLEKKLLRIRNKGGDDHLIPMLGDVYDAFMDYRFIRPVWETNHVFLACNGGTRQPDGVITPDGMRQRIYVLCQRAGLRKLNPHSFRHGLAMHLLNAKGADAAVIQRILGHSKIDTTLNLYAKWKTSGIQDVYRDLMEA